MKNKQNLYLLMMSFAPLIAFYAFEHFWGLKVAIAATVIVTVAEIIYRKIRKEALGAFFYFIAVTTIAFGLIDVFSEGTTFFKYEPALTNFITGFYFAYGATTVKPMILEFAEKAKKIDPEKVTPEFVYFLRAVTWMWVVYFIIKAFAYLWLANKPETSTGQMMVIRTLAGNASMFLMLGVSWVLNKPLYRWVLKRHGKIPI